MGTYKWFTDEEVAGLMPDICFKLDRARELFGAAIIITSGYRDPEHNESAGGVKDSAHTTGMAVDIRCNDSELQKKLIWALCCAGFRRIGVYDRHIHADVRKDDGVSPMAFWTGESK